MKGLLELFNPWAFFNGNHSRGLRKNVTVQERPAPPTGPPAASEVVQAWTAEQFLGRALPAKIPLAEGLLHTRDLVALGARRRHGKTSLTTDLAVSLAVPANDFLGYRIPEARRSLLLVLEDDPGEYQEKLRKVIGERDTGGRIRIIGRDDFYEAGIPIDVRDEKFRQTVRTWADEHHPDLIVIDNLAHVIAAEYNDSKRVHELMTFCYRLAKDHNAAIILAAHPKKDDQEHPVSLEEDPAQFFESIMGSSHFINSTGSLWGLERPDRKDYSVFLGGRQRGEGHQAHSYIQMDDWGHFHVLEDAPRNLPLVVNTPTRQQAWNRLPNPPQSFGYNEGQQLAREVMHSSSTYAAWMRECRRLKVIIDAPDGKLSKAPGLGQVELST